MRVLHVNHTDLQGGAAVAAHRLVRAQREAGLDARMLVLHKFGSDDWVDQASGPAIALRVRIARAAAKRICRLAACHEPRAMRSLGFVPSGLGAEIRRVGPDIVHWHFVGAETISLGEMAGLKMPAIWTCHDQWAFCGAEHYAPDEGFATGYLQRHRTDPDRIAFRLKQRAWAGWHPAFVCPSAWMAGELGRSTLMQACRCEVIPNTLDFSTFRPLDQAQARAELGLPVSGSVALFGAFGGRRDPRKGFDLLVEALHLLPSSMRAGMTLATFGDGYPGLDEVAGLRVRQLGRIDDFRLLAMAYNAADVLVVPSRQDNLPNTMLEALACGTPCAAFDVGGLSDIVAAPLHGGLATAFDVAALRDCIVAQVNSDRKADRQTRHRDTAIRFGAARVVEAHHTLYRELLSVPGLSA